MDALDRESEDFVSAVSINEGYGLMTAGAAILICERAAINDTDIKRLCEGIVSQQQAEIDQMKAKLRQLDK